MGFDFGASPPLKTLSISKFRGVDFANDMTHVASNRSPNAENIMSDLAGKPVKRTGYKTVAKFGSRVNGIYRLKTEDVEKFIVHAGTKLYEWTRTDGIFEESGTEIYADMNNQRSACFQNDGRLFILDGKTYLCYGEFGGSYGVKKVSEIATVPVCILSLNPDGTGGTQRHDVNVLTSRRTYSFYVSADNASVKEFHLASSDMKLDDGAVTARKLNSDASWTDMVETTDFTVNRTTGVITFKTAPGKSPSTGVDNVEITFSAESEYTPDLINKCTIATQYGLNGATDRVFVAGNPDAINFHYWSDIEDPCYFPGLNYAYLGQDSSAIMGYSRIGNALAVHKEDNEQDHTIFLVTGTYNESTQKTNFAISGSAAGVGSISKYCFGSLGTEPVFLARQGVYALTTQYLTQERYAQVRSWYVNPRLVTEANLSEAVGKEYNNYFYLAVNGHVYVADGRQKVYEKNAPQNEYQYEWYYLTGIDARVFWEFNGYLYFGDNDGNVKMFKLASEDTGADPAYTDDGEAIRAIWDTPYFTMDTLSRYKNLKGFWVMLSPYRRSSIKVWYKVKGNMQIVRDNVQLVQGDLSMVKETTMDIFDFNEIDFTRFTFITDDSPMIVATNTKAKKFMLIQFRFENDVAGEGFGFYEAEATYTIAGKYKG